MDLVNKNNKNKKNNPESRIVLIGIILILGVFVFTFFSSLEKNAASENITEQVANTEQIDLISSDELTQKISREDKNLQIIDLREEASFQKDHIPGAINIFPLDLANYLENSDSQKTFVLVDENGANQSNISLSRANQLDLNIYYLAGGYRNWQESSFPSISNGDPFSFTDQSKVTYISSDELKTKIENEEKMLIIDLRSEEQFSQAHIPNSTNIHLDKLEAMNNEIPISSQIVVYDNDGNWAFKGAVRLFDLGYFNVLALSDGLDTWKQKGYVTENN